MNWETAYVFGVLAVAAIFMASGRVRLDVTALLVVLALALSGILTVPEALAGFGNPVVILVAGLLVVGEALTHTGVADAIGRWLSRTAGASEIRVLALTMLAAGVLGSVMNSTAVVVIFIPIVISIARRTGLNVSRLLLPLAYAALVSGMMTLIATTPNLIVNSALLDAGNEPLGFFSFTPIGVIVLVVAIAYVLVVGRRLLPGGGAATRDGDKDLPSGLPALFANYEMVDTARRYRVPATSPLVGRTLAECALGQRFGIRILLIEKMERFGWVARGAPSSQTVIRAGDALVFSTRQMDLEAFEREFGLERLAVDDDVQERWIRSVGVAEVLIHPESTLISKSLREAAFSSRHGLEVVGVKRKGKVLEDFLDVSLASSDALLVVGPWNRIGRLRSGPHDFVVLALPSEIEQVVAVPHRAPVAIAILLGMVALSAFEIVPVVIAVLIAALAAVLTGCLTMEDGYRAIHWSSLVLIAGLIPIADALARTGGIRLVTEGLVAGVGGFPPMVMMTVLFFATALLSMVLSNTATALLMAPIAVSAAAAMGVQPQLFAMTVAIAASAAFMTPVSSPVVTLVVAPGNYRFTDFIKLGAPLLVLTWLVTLLIAPLLFPL